MLSRTMCNRIADCTHILRTGHAEFVLRVSVHQDQPGPHLDAKLRRWMTALLLSSPALPIGTLLSLLPALRNRQAPPDLRRYRVSHCLQRQGGDNLRLFWECACAAAYLIVQWTWQMVTSQSSNSSNSMHALCMHRIARAQP